MLQSLFFLVIFDREFLNSAIYYEVLLEYAAVISASWHR
jgi:hypothetical protein